MRAFAVVPAGNASSTTLITDELPSLKPSVTVPSCMPAVRLLISAEIGRVFVPDCREPVDGVADSHPPVETTLAEYVTAAEEALNSVTFCDAFAPPAVPVSRTPPVETRIPGVASGATTFSATETVCGLLTAFAAITLTEP